MGVIKVGEKPRTEADAMRAGLAEIMLIAGQPPRDATGAMPDGILAQFRASAARVRQLLEDRGSSMDDVLRAEIRIAASGPQSYTELQKAYLETFQEPRPARCVSAVKSLPGGAVIELGVIAAPSRAPGVERQAVVAPDGPMPCAPFPHARTFGKGAWATAQVGSDPKSGSLDPIPGGAAAQLRQAIDNLSKILKASGASLAGVVHGRVQYVGGVDEAALASVVAETPWPAGIVELSAVPFIPTAQTGVLVKVDAIARRG